MSRGVDAPAYHAGLAGDRKIELEQRLLRDDVKALVATVALGMGFDKPNLGFVVHFQRPGSVVAYYQQIGRAGRAVDRAYAILLNGREDDEIQDYFINSAFPGVEAMQQVLGAIEESAGLTKGEILSAVNLSSGRVERCLKLLEVDGAIAHEGREYVRTFNPWEPDVERSHRVTALRRWELERMQTFIDSPTCLMEFVARELDDPEPCPCGRCAVCVGRGMPTSVDPGVVREAIGFLRRDSRTIAPRRVWPTGAIDGRCGRIGLDIRNAQGRALCIYGDAGWGRAVIAGKYRDGRFDDVLARAAAELVRTHWMPDPLPAWVTAIPSLRRPALVPDFAARLASALRLPYRDALVKVKRTAEQKTMQNSAQQAANIASAFQVVDTMVMEGPVLLIDDVVDSGWTLTVCGVLLREAGSGIVHPFALATTVGAGDVS